jgi:tetratricopeptide (TPR) repeat protein
VKHLRAALAIRRRQHGDNHVAVARANYDLAVILQFDTKGETETLVRQARLIVRDHSDIEFEAKCLQLLIIYLGRIDRDSDASNAFRELLELRRKWPGDKNRGLYEALSILLSRQDWLNDAEAFLLDAIHLIPESEWGELASVYGGLAKMMHHKGDGSAGRAYKRKSIELEIKQHTRELSVDPTLHLYRIRAYNRIRLGQFKEALADFSKVIELGADSEHYWHHCAALYLLTDDLQGYDAHRRRMLQQWEQYHSVYIADATLLAPVTTDKLATIRRISTTNENELEFNESLPTLSYKSILPILEFRTGNYQTAYKMFAEYENVAGHRGADSVRATYFQAMALHHLGKAQEALDLFKSAEAVQEAKFDLLLDENTSLELLVAQREAKALIKGKAGESRPTTQP